MMVTVTGILHTMTILISLTLDTLDHDRGATDTTQFGPIDIEISISMDNLGSMECYLLCSDMS